MLSFVRKSYPTVYNKVKLLRCLIKTKIKENKTNK